MGFLVKISRGRYLLIRGVVKTIKSDWGSSENWVLPGVEYYVGEGYALTSRLWFCLLRICMYPAP